MHIDIIQSSVTGQWGYCPTNAPESFKKCLAYDDESGEATAADAIAAARANKGMKGATLTFTEYPNPNWKG